MPPSQVRERERSAMNSSVLAALPVKLLGPVGQLVALPVAAHALGSSRYALFLAASSAASLVSSANLGQGPALATELASARQDESRSQAGSESRNSLNCPAVERTVATAFQVLALMTGFQLLVACLVSALLYKPITQSYPQLEPKELLALFFTLAASATILLLTSWVPLVRSSRLETEFTSRAQLYFRVPSILAIVAAASFAPYMWALAAARNLLPALANAFDWFRLRHSFSISTLVQSTMDRSIARRLITSNLAHTIAQASNSLSIAAVSSAAIGRLSPSAAATVVTAFAFNVSLLSLVAQQHSQLTALSARRRLDGEIEEIRAYLKTSSLWIAAIVVAFSSTLLIGNLGIWDRVFAGSFTISNWSVLPVGALAATLMIESMAYSVLVGTSQNWLATLLVSSGAIASLVLVLSLQPNGASQTIAIIAGARLPFALAGLAVTTHSRVNSLRVGNLVGRRQSPTGMP